MLSIDSTLTLNNGIEMPIFGFGVYDLAEGKKGEQAILSALENGYKHLDTASIYQNEDLVGNAWTGSGIKREDLFITTKLWVNEQGEKETPEAMDRSLEKLQTDYVDLYLIHWPHPDDALMQPCWEAMQLLLEQGKCRAIGVSNFTRKRLEKLFSFSSFLPAVNQMEFNLFYYRQEIMEYCRSHNILFESFSPLARCHKLDHPTLVSIAQKYAKKPTQIMLRWCLEHAVPIIPKSSSPARIKENKEIFDFEINAADMRILDTLSEDYETSTWRPDPDRWY